VPPYARIGRHRAPDGGLRVALRAASPRHARPGVPAPGHRSVATPPAPGRRLRAFAAAIAVLLVVDAALLAVRLGQGNDDTHGAVLALPTITIPAPSTAGTHPARGPAADRAQRRVARPRTPPPSPRPSASPSATPVLLGPQDLRRALTSYCRHTDGRRAAAFATADGWVCARLFARPRAISMDAACRHLYGDAAWAGMLDDNDELSWRCYRDGT
jgi:hypothetical protein